MRRSSLLLTCKTSECVSISSSSSLFTPETANASNWLKSAKFGCSGICWGEVLVWAIRPSASTGRCTWGPAPCNKKIKVFSDIVSRTKHISSQDTEQPLCVYKNRKTLREKEVKHIDWHQLMVTQILGSSCCCCKATEKLFYLSHVRSAEQLKDSSDWDKGKKKKQTPNLCKIYFLPDQPTEPTQVATEPTRTAKITKSLTKEEVG